MLNRTRLRGLGVGGDSGLGEIGVVKALAKSACPLASWSSSTAVVVVDRSAVQLGLGEKVMGGDVCACAS